MSVQPLLTSYCSLCNEKITEQNNKKFDRALKRHVHIRCDGKQSTLSNQDGKQGTPNGSDMNTTVQQVQAYVGGFFS